MTYLDGALLIVGGLSIVRVHNRWARGWPLLTTLAGWSALLLGLGRMFAPEVGQPGRDAATVGGARHVRQRRGADLQGLPPRRPPVLRLKAQR